ncbi:MAG: ornithine carbamoyltransferase [Kiritimatiellia bacterium]|nr:ornithine carbamoyltransferase [Kiritimatiellia bacterium]
MKNKTVKDLITLDEWTPDFIRSVLDLGVALKRNPTRWAHALERKTLCMIFEKPSLRTRISFEAGMSQLGGHAIHYDLNGSPLAAGKETIEDTARVLSRFVDAIMARLFRHDVIEAMAAHATIPVINGLTDYSHPTQILADLITVTEKKGDLRGRTLAFLGDGFNNVTHSLLTGCAKVGMNIRVGCPDAPDTKPDPNALSRAARFARESGSDILVTEDPVAAVTGADVVYTDSWMSYHIPADKREERIARFTPYQVTASLMRNAHPDALFMNCLPAQRGCEQTAEVIDGPQSVVFDQAENRLHAHKAILVSLLS